MKKIIIFIFAFVVLFAGAAYVGTDIMTEPVNTTLSYDQSYVWYTGLAKDTIGIGDSVYTFPVRKKSLSKVAPYAYISIDSTGGTANVVTVTLESKAFEDESYIVRETASWTLGGDTVIKLLSDTAHISEFWQVKLSGADDTFKAKILKLNLKFAVE